MPINLSPAELFGIATIIIGGFWTLMKMFFSAQRKLLDERHESVRELILTTEEKFSTALSRMEHTREGFEKNFHELDKDFLRFKADAAEKYALKTEISNLLDGFNRRVGELLEMVHRLDVKIDRNIIGQKRDS